jgi:hypothetical protein
VTSAEHVNARLRRHLMERNAREEPPRRLDTLGSRSAASTLFASPDIGWGMGTRDDVYCSPIISKETKGGVIRVDALFLASLQA